MITEKQSFFSCPPAPMSAFPCTFDADVPVYVRRGR
jgi:hypothetical protein